uniref:Uncharacterized protein n=1 Tax=Arion vulgaris TaxID=1028688 RepID=A0A0B7ASH8_9EUPU
MYYLFISFGKTYGTLFYLSITLRGQMDYLTLFVDTTHSDLTQITLLVHIPQGELKSIILFLTTPRVT